MLRAFARDLGGLVGGTMVPGRRGEASGLSLFAGEKPQLPVQQARAPRRLIPEMSGYAVAHLLWVRLVDPKQESAIFNHRPHGIEDPVITESLVKNDAPERCPVYSRRGASQQG